mgnify:CR=1 FL=1
MDAEKALAAEREARAARCGKLDAPLYEALTEGGGTPLPVAIWLRLPPELPR